jgi:hypothetical protein
MPSQPDPSRRNHSYRSGAAIGVLALAAGTLAVAVPADAAPAVSGIGLRSNMVRALDAPVHATARVLGADGQPLAGVTVTFTVAGANPITGSRVTGTDGRAVFVHATAHAGPDRTTATVGSVASRQVTTLVEKGDSDPKFYVKSPAKGVVDVGVRALPVLAGREVGIYEVDRNNVSDRKRVANLLLGADATGAFTFTGQRSGRVLALEVRVLPTTPDDYREYYTGELVVTVR